MLCFPSPFSSKGGSHASFVDRGLTTGIPTGCSRPPYLNRSSYRSLSPIAGWKGSASEPYVKLPPHTGLRDHRDSLARTRNQDQLTSTSLHGTALRGSFASRNRESISYSIPLPCIPECSKFVIGGVLRDLQGLWRPSSPLSCATEIFLGS